MSSKGKTVASGKGKGKWTGDEDKSGGGGGRKRRNREVLQFFEDAAEEDDYDSGEDSDLNFDFDDFMDEDVKEPAKAQNVSFLPKEEEMDEEEFDKLMEDRYKSNPRLQACRDDVYDDISMPSGKTPTIWKVKCTVGRERHSVFCLMQKFVDLKSLGNKLQIISAFVVDHAKGFVYIEAEKQVDINEACKGISTIYSSRLAPVPKNEVSHLLAIRNNKNPISEGMWARVKNGRYKGDLAQIVFVNDERRKATVMLIPRIDLQVLAQKIGGGVAPKNAVIPAPKLITSTELDEFRPLMTCRHDRDTSKMFEVLDGNMLKDGFLYKKVPIDSLSCHGIVPLEEELLKFRPSESNKSDNLEWLKELYGAPKKKRGLGNDKGGEKGGGSSASGTLDGFELYELVCYGRKDFGLVVGMEKEGDYYKILKQGPEGPIVDSAPKHSLKHGPSDVKFNALDHKSKRISVDDTVRVFEGPLKDKEGIAKQIYKGIIFIYDENETENGGYFCSKAQMCEKVELSSFAFSEKGGESGSSGFEDFPSSPKSPLSPPKPWQTKEKDRNFSQGDKDGMFAVGQTLRIKVGPLKGYLCQVLGIRYSDITVKLGSQQKILTVKSEHLSEVRGRSSAVPTSDDPGSSSFKPFDVLGTEGGSGGWGDEAKTSNDGDGWNTGDVSSERTSWAGFATGSDNANPSSSLDNDAKKEDAWDTKVSPNLNSSWGAAAADDNLASDSNQAQGWGKKEDSWNKAVGETDSKAIESVGWGKTVLPSENSAGGVKTSSDNWGQANPQEGGSSDAGGGWGTAKSIDNPTSSWGAGNTGQSQPGSWGNVKGVTEGGSGEKNMSSSAGGGWNNKDTGFNHEKSEEKADTWGKAAEVQDKCAVQGDSWGKAAGGSSSHAVEGWGNAGAKTQPEAGSADAANAWKQDTSDGANQTSNWGSGSASQKQTGGWNNPQTEPSVGKQDSSWIIHEGGASWNKQQGESSWGKQDGGSSWSNKQDGEQQSGGWNSASDGGRGSAGRRGRGGRWGGRDQSAGGRSFGQGQSSGWEGEKEDDGGNSSNPSSWSKNSGAGWGKSKPEVESSSPSFRSWMGADTGTDGSGNKDLSSKGVSMGKTEGASWNASSADQPSSWGTKSAAVDTKTDQSTGKGWGESAADANKDSVWNSEPSNAGGNAESSWGKKKEWNSGGAGKEWGKGAGDANKGSDWNSEPSIAGGNAEPSWGKKKEWDSGDAGKYWGKGTGDANKGSGWNSEPSNAGGSQWGKKGDWNSGSSENQNSGWGNKSSWSSQQENANQYSQGDGDGTRGGWRGGSGGSGGFRGRGDRGGFRGRSDRGGFEGRGDRGGFGGRGDRGGFGGRSRSDEGGFRGRGRSDRGGFGGRGRGRRDFNGGNDNNGGSSWSSGGDGTNNQGGGWSSQNSGWSHSTATKDSGNDNAAGGWSKGQGSNSQGGGWGSKPSGSGDADATGNQTKSWNQSGAAGGGWGNNSKEAGGGGASGSGWGSSKEAGAGGTSGSGWGNSKEAGGGGASGSGWGNSKEAGGGGASGSGWGNSKEAGGGGTSGSGWGN